MVIFSWNAESGGGLSLVWLIGCWPPARYLVASGMLTVKSGWVQLAAAGITLQARPPFSEAQIIGFADSCGITFKFHLVVLPAYVMLLVLLSLRR